MHRYLLISFCILLGTELAAQKSGKTSGSGAAGTRSAQSISPCTLGPNLVSVSAENTGAMVFSFHGVNVTEIAYTVSGSKPERSGRVKPTSSSVSVQFEPLKPGKYLLHIQGVNCSGSSQMAFSVVEKAKNTISSGMRSASGLSYTVTPKQFFNLINQNGMYSDQTPGDYSENGQTYRNENGRKYRAFYWINEMPYQSNAGTPLRFENVALPAGHLLTIRKVYVDAAWKPTFSAVLQSGWETWYQNPQADPDRIWKTVMLSFTSVGGNEPVSGKVTLKKNPSWLNAGKLVPQYFFNPAPVLPDKPVGIQCFPSYPGNPEKTFATLKAAGITHVWDMAMHAQGFFDNAWRPTGKNPSGITRALMLGTQGLGEMFPGLKPYGGQLTHKQAEQWADRQQLFDGAIITDEFAEGTYPQFDQSREWFYSRLSQRIKTGGFKNVQLVGEYGYASQKMGIPQNPLSAYARSLLQPAFINNLESVPGSGDTKFKHYVQAAGQYRGNCIGGYYAITENPTHWIYNFAYNTIQYNATPDKPRLLFTWAGMQSNGTMIDTPQREAGTRRPDGSISTNFPDTPPEIMKIMGFFGLLFYDSVYMWDAYGTPSPTNENAWTSCGISQDAWIVGTRWYSELIPALKEAGNNLLVADYRTEKGAFVSKTPERKIPARGKPVFGNIYFNETKAAQRGMAIVIPSTKPRFIYINPSLPVWQKERVSINYDGKLYDLGEIPGMTLAVSD